VKDNKKPDATTSAEDVIMAQVLGSPDRAALSSPTAMAAMQQELMALFLERLRAEKAKQEAEQERARQARLAGARAQEEAAARERAMQASCNHTKPFGGPAIAAQRDHQHNTHWICLYCGKTWLNAEIPPHLRIPSEEIGGPLA
jgi:rubrerythrin